MSKTTRRGFLMGAGGAVLGGAALAAPAPAVASVARPKPAGGAVVVVPGDVRYPGLVRGANQRFVGSPGRVVIPGRADDVVQLVGEAVSGGRRVGVRSGGHCYESFVANDEVRDLVDMSRMCAVGYDQDHGAFSVGAGATLGTTYRSLFTGWGLAVPAGSCPSVGVGGFVPNGGYGPLSRRHGLTADHLYGVELVVVDASGTPRVVLATRDDSGALGDLWWAHTGAGGGSLGIATRYLFRSPAGSAKPLPEPPAEVLLRTVVWPWSTLDEGAFVRLVTNFGAWHEANSAPGSPGCDLFAQLKLLSSNAGVVAMSVQVDAGVSGAEDLLDRFVAEVSAGVGTPVGAPAMRRPWHHALQWDGFNPSNPTVMRFKIKSAYMRSGFPPEQATALWRNLSVPGPAAGTTLVSISSYGGRINAVDPSSTATVARDSIMKLQYIGLWERGADDAALLDRVRTTYADVYSATGGVPVSDDVTDGCYIGYADADLNDPTWNTSGVPWHSLYFGSNYGRLQRAKRAWDPRDVFRHAQSIRL
ncbi:FAD-binding oxidoreductase [Antribacter sp. KLBMP9083]|uniref:FAD-binding oxidoreductase n=1 Tax=Antribacter soli TaxID=2910976 RepID=A0AA41QII7_9MICO|nr:FAD-binding oxidoreductase [Antribacter soli]MCF4123366.1 FAD-binding oxidoreductase [Antribacter soli]